MVRVDFGEDGAPRRKAAAFVVADRPLRMPCVAEDPARGVVHRHPGVGVAGIRRQIARRQRVVRHEELGHAPVQFPFSGMARRAEQHPGRMAQHREARRRVLRDPAQPRHARRFVVAAPQRRGTRLVQANALAVADAGVQKGKVRRVQAALAGLRPVALLELLGDEPLLRWHREKLEVRQRWRVLRAEPGPDNATGFRDLQRANAGARLHPLGNGRFDIGHIHAAPIGVELPAVVGAAQAARLHAPEEEMRAAMRAPRSDDADAPGAVAERDELLAEELQALWRAVGLRQFAAQQRRHPVVPEHRAHGRPRPGLGQDCVLLGGQHVALAL